MSMFLKRYQRKFLVVFVLALGFPLIATIVSRYLSEPRLISDPIPSAQPYQKPTQTPLPVISKPPILPIEINLDIPFTSQAPNQNWVAPFKEFCEEASVLMVSSFINRQVLGDSNFVSQKLLEIKAFEDKRFGFYEDTNAEETAIILREFYKITKVKVVYEPRIEDIKTALAEGKAVIIPAAGRMLGNPYFQRPGPLYHMLVIKGYTKEGNLITNDPGTRHGANYIYSPDTIMNAIHDWNGGDVNNGRKVMIVVG